MSIDLREFSGSSFVKLGDVKDGPVQKEIAAVAMGKYGRPDLVFTDGSRMSANATNVKTLRRAYGDDSESLIGKEVELFEGEIEFQSQMKPAVLIRPVSPPDNHEAVEAAAARNQTDPDDDLIPF